MNDIHEHTADAVVASVASKATYVGAGTSFIGWLTTSEAGVAVGIILGIVGFIVNLYFKRREDRRQQEQHDAQMRAIRGDHL